MGRKELNLIWEENPSWFGCTQTMLYPLKAWLLKRIRALEEGKAEHPLSSGCPSSALHTSIMQHLL